MDNTRAVAGRFIRYMEDGHPSDAFKLIGENGRYILIGTTPVSGTYHGRADIEKRIDPVLAGSTEPPPKMKFSETIVQGDRVVMLASGQGKGPQGRPYDQPYYAYVARVDGDCFAELIEFCDTVMIQSCWFGKVLVPCR